MTWQHKSDWKPTQLLEVAGSVDTSTGATEVMTDAGRAFIKPMGNRQGPHVLATDWVGTHLARWFGLSTFDIAILPLTDDDTFPLPRGHFAEAGPAFATRAMKGEPWGNSGLQLNVLVNPEDISRLVVFDTWTLNCDRHHHDLTARKPNPDNVYLSSEDVEPGKRKLIAMDHGLCFIRSGEDLTPKLANIEKTKNDNVFGLFPEFCDRLKQDVVESSLARLREMEKGIADKMVESIPDAWEVSSESRKAWKELICARADYVAENFNSWLDKTAPWFGANKDSKGDNNG